MKSEIIKNLWIEFNNYGKYYAKLFYTDTSFNVIFCGASPYDIWYMCNMENYNKIEIYKDENDENPIIIKL